MRYSVVHSIMKETLSSLVLKITLVVYGSADTTTQT
jgi:hypothetical protein